MSAMPDSTTGPRGPTSSRRSRVAIAAGVALVAAALVTAAVLRSRGAPAAAGDGQALAPIQTARDAATGEDVEPFSGFAVSVETDPPGAMVSIAGVPRGEAPVLADVRCAPGDPVPIRAQLGGRAADRATACRRDALVKLRLVLPRK